MKQFKCVFSIEYWDNIPKDPVEHIIYAKSVEELQRNALKVFVNDQIEDETGVLDNAVGVSLLSFYFLPV